MAKKADKEQPPIEEVQPQVQEQVPEVQPEVVEQPMPQEPAAAKDRSALYTPVAIVVAGFFVASGLFMGLSSQQEGGAQVAGAGQVPQAQAVNIKNIKVDDEPYIGRADAPVVLAYWSDFQCPFCKKFDEEVLPALISQYVETGKLKIVFKDFPFLSEDSTDAALYGRAVWDLYPTSYYAWREGMYREQDEEHGGFGDAASIDALNATIAGIDAAQVKARVASMKAKYDEAVQADLREGQANGVSGTPGFITGKQAISGAQPLAAFTEAINAQLK